MKKYLIIIALFISFTSVSQIIGTTYKLDSIEIAQFDLPTTTTWYNAKRECKELGKGWRLPTKSELNILYNNRRKMGNVSDWEGYWTSTLVPKQLWDPTWTSDEIGEGIVWRQYFTSGIQGYASMSNDKCVVRAVKLL